MKQIFIWVLCVFGINAYSQLSLTLKHNVPVNAAQITAIKMSSDSRFLAYGTREGLVYVWDLTAGQKVGEFKYHRSAINALCFDANSQYLLSGADDKKVIIWNLDSSELYRKLEDIKIKINELVLSPNNNLLAASGDKKEILLFDFPLGTQRGKLQAHRKDIIALAFNKDGTRLLSVAKDKQVITWDVNTHKLIRKTGVDPATLKHSGLDIQTAAFSADKSIFALGIQEHVLEKGGREMLFKSNLSLYNWKSGSEINTFQIFHSKDINLLSISPDNRYAVIDNSTLRQPKFSFLNLETGGIDFQQPVEGEITALDISQDGSWFALGVKSDADKSQSTLKVWQLSNISPLPVSSCDVEFTTPSDPLIKDDNEIQMAILYFKHPNLDFQTAEAVTYILETKLGNSDFLKLTERNQIDKVLKELKFQESGLTEENAVEVGKYLNAHYVMMGSINKLGELIVITSKLINVETAGIAGTRGVQCRNAKLDDISDLVAALAASIIKQ